MVSFSLTIVRHGETAANANSMIQGQIDEPLNDKGRNQARLLGQSFAKLGRPAFTHAFSSDLRRAKETCEIILAHHVGPVHCAIECDKRVRERSYGTLEGKAVTFLRSEAKKANLRTLDYVCPGGESLSELMARAIDFFDDMCRRLEREEQMSVPQRMRHSSSGRRIARLTSSTNMPVWREEDAMPDSAFEQQDGDMHFFMDTPPLPTEPPSTALAPASSMDSGLPADFDEVDVTRGRATSETACEFEDALTNGNDADGGSGGSASDPTSGTEAIACGSTSSWWLTVAQRKESTRSLGACSDDSFFPEVDAHVLLVAHGGWIRELLRHLCELNSLLHRPAALRSSPNTGVSRFMITIDGGVSATCLELHNRDHLLDS
uniref:Fructose-2,6-bisphosphatase TIGAR n=1 Tax=Plectus sambesii TaxID=2011161 RepID=A0A914VJ56_9BILA